MFYRLIRNNDKYKYQQSNLTFQNGGTKMKSSKTKTKTAVILNEYHVPYDNSEACNGCDNYVLADWITVYSLEGENYQICDRHSNHASTLRKAFSLRNRCDCGPVRISEDWPEDEEE